MEVQHHFTTCETFHQHVLHMEDGTKQCALCGKQFKAIKFLYTHFGKAHFPSTSRRRKCQTCDESYNPNSKHVELCAKYSTNIAKVNEKYRCLQCHKMTDTLHGMFIHHIHHKGERKQSTVQVRQVLPERKAKAKATKFFTELSDSDHSFGDDELSDDAPPSTSRRQILENNLDDDSDIEIVDEVRSPQANAPTPPPKDEQQSMNRLDMDTNQSVCRQPANDEAAQVEDEYEDTQLRFESKGFVGAVLRLYYCDLCDPALPFQTKEFCIDHLKKYHKIAKDYAKHMRIRKC